MGFLDKEFKIGNFYFTGLKAAIIGGTSIAVISIITITILFFGLFLKPTEKVYWAMGNTLKGNLFVEKYNEIASFELGEEYTTSLKAELEDGYIIVSVPVTKEQKAITLAFKENEKDDLVGYIPSSGDAYIVLDDTNLYLYMQGQEYNMYTAQLDKSVHAYKYDYTKIKPIEGLTESDMKAVNDILKSIYEGKNANTELTDEILEILKEEFSTLEYEKGEKETYEINDRKVEATLYTLRITEKDFNRAFERVYETLKEKGEYELEEYTLIEDIEIEINYYLTTRTVSRINVKLINTAIEDESGTASFDIYFHGKSYPTQSMSIYIDEELTYELQGEKKGSIEYLNFITKGEDKDFVKTLEYDRRTNDFVYTYETDYDEYTYKGNLGITKDEICFKYTSSTIPKYSRYSSSSTITITVKNEAEPIKIDKSIEFIDITELSQDSLNSLVEEVNE